MDLTAPPTDRPLKFTAPEALQEMAELFQAMVDNPDSPNALSWGSQAQAMLEEVNAELSERQP